MPLAILTGAPGVGKTTLLQALAAAGLRTVPESARALIQERKAQGLPPRPAPLVFAQQILQRDMAAHQTACAAPGWTVCDRGALEAIGGVHALAPFAPAELQALLQQHRVDQAFLLPLWPAIYRTDAERDQTLAEAAQVEARITQWYAAVGQPLQVLPHAPVAERVRWVLRALGLPEAGAP